MRAYSVGAKLFDARLAQAGEASSKATIAAQKRFDASEESDSLDSEAAMQLALEAASQTASTPGANTQIAILRSAGQPFSASPIDRVTGGLVASTIPQELRDAVANSKERRTFSQSITLEHADGTDVAGIVVGSVLTVPSSGQYELYVVNDLSDTEETLAQLQQTLLLGGLALVVLIGAVTFVVVRLVVGPVRMAADTSEKLAAGQLEVRIPEKGEDVIATLARSFNGMADSLQQQITRLAALSQVQQRFVSDVSHELRTPLTTIRLAGDVLYDQRESFPPATARTAELLHTQVERFETAALRPARDESVRRRCGRHGGRAH